MLTKKEILVNSITIVMLALIVGILVIAIRHTILSKRINTPILINTYETHTFINGSDHNIQPAHRIKSGSHISINDALIHEETE